MFIGAYDFWWVEIFGTLLTCREFDSAEDPLMLFDITFNFNISKIF